MDKQYNYLPPSRQSDLLSLRNNLMSASRHLDSAREALFRLNYCHAYFGEPVNSLMKECLRYSVSCMPEFAEIVDVSVLGSKVSDRDIKERITRLSRSSGMTQQMLISKSILYAVANIERFSEINDIISDAWLRQSRHARHHSVTKQVPVEI